MTPYTALSVAQRAAALCNDSAQQVYTFTALLPYLNQALQELQEIFELNEIPCTQTASAVLNVPAGTSEITFEPDTPDPDVDYLPDDLVEPQLLWERPEGIDPFIPMTRLNVLPLQQSGVEINQLVNYVWEDQKIKFLPANQDNDVKMNYIKTLFAEITEATDTISIINSQSFLQYRTAGLAARFIGENPTRAQDLDGDASLALDRVTGIGTKGRQSIFTRRRPFRQGWKRNTFV